MGRHALERAEIGQGQRRALEVAQQLDALAAAGLHLGFALLAQRAAALELLASRKLVLLADLPGRLAVQVKALLGSAQRDQVARRTGVAAKERRELGLRKTARRALLDVCLDAQLQRLVAAAKERREERLERGGDFSRCGLWRLPS